MTLKEFGENAEIVYSLKVFVNDEEEITIESYSEDSLLEQLRKVDTAIANAIERQYQDLPEPIEDESRGYND